MSSRGLRAFLPKPRRAKPQYREQHLVQFPCIDFLRRCVPPAPDGPAWTAINPVPAKSKIVAALCKKLGMNAGWMDLLMIFNGRPILVEFKAGGGSLSKSQVERSDEIKAAGGIVHECRSLDEFLEILDFHGIPCMIVRR
jgi:hypothetical protein